MGLLAYAFAVGGRTSTGTITVTVMMIATTCSPLAYDPLAWRMCAISNGPKALANPQAVRRGPMRRLACAKRAKAPPTLGEAFDSSAAGELHGRDKVRQHDSRVILQQARHARSHPGVH